MFEADSQRFASAPSVPRGFTLQNFRPAFGADHRRALGGLSQPPPPLQTPPLFRPPPSSDPPPLQTPPLFRPPPSSDPPPLQTPPLFRPPPSSDPPPPLQTPPLFRPPPLCPRFYYIPRGTGAGGRRSTSGRKQRLGGNFRRYAPAGGPSVAYHSGRPAFSGPGAVFRRGSMGPPRARRSPLLPRGHPRGTARGTGPARRGHTGAKPFFSGAHTLPQGGGACLPFWKFWVPSAETPSPPPPGWG